MTKARPSAYPEAVRSFAKMLEARKRPWDEPGSWDGKDGTRGPAGVLLTGDCGFSPVLFEALLGRALHPPVAVTLPEHVVHTLDLE